MDYDIITLGLTKEQNEKVKRNFPTDEYDIIVAKTFTDVIALTFTTAIINANAIKESERRCLFSFYEQVGGALYETICWIGRPLPSTLTKTIKYFKDMKEFELNMKDFLLEAHNLYKKPKNFTN